MRGGGGCEIKKVNPTALPISRVRRTAASVPCRTVSVHPPAPDRYGSRPPPPRASLPSTPPFLICMYEM